jgi:hypothetical protein
MESNLRDPRHWPYIGSVVEYLAERNDPAPSPVPRNFGLPFPIGSKRRAKPGALGGFLGSAYDTIWSEFAAEGTRELLRDAGAPDVEPKVVADPFVGIRPTDRLESVATDQTFSVDRLNGQPFWTSSKLQAPLWTSGIPDLRLTDTARSPVRC